MGAQRPDVPPSPSPKLESTDIPMRVTDPANQNGRGIRSISAPARTRPRIGGEGVLPPRPPRSFSGRWIWVVAIVCLIALGILLLFAFRSTTVTVTPTTHLIVFDQTSQFTAYPAASAATGTLPYTVQTSDLQGSEVVTSEGTTTVQVASKASGTITVVNNYSASRVSLVATTRFETPNGLIFRVPVGVVIPGKKGSTPGTVNVTVVADQTGTQYNVTPVSRFTIPGLKSNAAMYANVYAKSSASMTGGSSGGSGSGVSQGARDAAVSDIRSQLLTQAEDAATAQTNATQIAFPYLIQITYQDLPDTQEAGGGTRLHEQANVVTPIFPADLFAQSVAQSVAADSNNSPITFVPGTGFAAQMATSSSAIVGTDPINFTLSGQAELIWTVDTSALAAALAGKDQSAFQTIVNTFPGIAEAHARIEPFWKNTFPTNPDDIKITISAPQFLPQ